MYVRKILKIPNECVNFVYLYLDLIYLLNVDFFSIYELAVCFILVLIFANTFAESANAVFDCGTFEFNITLSFDL